MRRSEQLLQYLSFDDLVSYVQSCEPSLSNLAGVSEHNFQGGPFHATVASLGAEPTSIRHERVGEVLWQAGPAWPKHAPVLFPIVGELASGTYRYDGASYALPRHGFARASEFAWTERASDRCTLRLVDDEQTRANYPFAFVLTIRYAIDATGVAIDYTIDNPGDVTLPASLGAHPAFAWPLVAGDDKTAYHLKFAENEPERIRRLAGNLLDVESFPTPIVGNDLALDPSLFDRDAIVLDRPRSVAVRYGTTSGPCVTVSWSGFEQLGIWSKRGGDFVCIEPWHGYADSVAFTGDIRDKPGIALIAPGDSASYRMHIAVS